MARLSINDMNNLSGINDSNLEELSCYFKKAHKKVLNDAIKWKNRYKRNIIELKKKNYISMKIARELYYEGSLAIDAIDRFIESSNEYISIKSKLKIEYKDVFAYDEILNKIKKEIIPYMQHCYRVWDEIATIIYKEEE